MPYDIELTPKVTDESSLNDLEGKISDIEKKGINLKVNVNTNNAESDKEIKKNISSIARLIQELNVLAGFDESKLTKTVNIHVNVDNLTEEITKGLATLNHINPNIAINTDVIEKRFKKLREEYNDIGGRFYGLTNDLAEEANVEDFNQAVKYATQLYDILSKIDFLLEKDSSLETRLGGGLKLESVKDFYEGTVEELTFTAEKLGKNEEEIEKIMNKISNIKTPVSDQSVFNLPKIETAKEQVTEVENTTAANSAMPNNNNCDNESGKQSLITTLIAPKLTAIQTHLSNIENKVTRDGNASKGSDDATAPPASSDVKNINTNVGTISTTVKTIGDKVAEISKKIGTSSKSKSESKGKDNTTGIKDKLNNLPTVLNSIKQTNASTSKNTKAIQTNTGNISTKVGQVRDTIKSKADAIAGQLSSIDTHISQGNTPASPDAATKGDYAALESAIKTLTQTLQTPTKTGNAQNAQNNATAPSPAQAAANLANVSNLQTQAINRIKELQTVLGFMNNGTFSNIFGSTQDIQSYITSIETLNKEIASAGRLLNRNDISATQRSNAEKKLSTDTAVLNGYINGDDSLNISTSQIANINALLHGMETINSRITGTDTALEGLKRLKDTLDSYNITVQPLNDAINGLKSTRDDLKQMADKLSDSSLTEGELANLQNSITAAEQSYQDVINKSNDLLNTNQKNSLQSITNEFENAQKEVNKYSSKIESLKKLLQDLKKNKIDLTSINMGNQQSAKDLETFITNYERFLGSNKNIADTQQMQTFATEFRANYQQPLKEFTDGLGNAKAQLTQLTTAVSQSIQDSNFSKQLADFTTRVEKWKNTNSNAFKNVEFADEYNRILQELTSGTVRSTERLAQLRAEFANLNLRVNQASVATKNFTTKVKEMFKKYGGWTLVTKTMNTALRLLRSMVTEIKEVDTAMTNLRKVTEATGNQLNTFLESAGKRSVDLGASLTDYIDAVSEFSRLGKALDEAQKLGELATTYKTVAEDLDIKTASKSIISTMQAFSGIGVQAEEIVDKFNYVGKILPLITISVKVQRWIRPR